MNQQNPDSEETTTPEESFPVGVRGGRDGPLLRGTGKGPSFVEGNSHGPTDQCTEVRYTQEDPRKAPCGHGGKVCARNEKGDDHVRRGVRRGVPCGGSPLVCRDPYTRLEGFPRERWDTTSTVVQRRRVSRRPTPTPRSGEKDRRRTESS